MINFDRRVKTRAEDHIKTEKHRNHVQLSQRQTYMDSVPDKNNEFFADLTKALVKSNIPLNKVENPNLKSFLEKWTKKELPSESTLRKTYVERCFVQLTWILSPQRQRLLINNLKHLMIIMWKGAE